MLSDSLLTPRNMKDLILTIGRFAVLTILSQTELIRGSKLYFRAFSKTRKLSTRGSSLLGRGLYRRE